MLSACGTDGNDELARRASDGGTNYVASDGSVQDFAPENRKDPVEFESEGVQVFGVNIRDAPPNVEAFERTFGITYPSMDARGGEVMMALTNCVHPSAVPTTLVLDPEGRVSSRINGLVEPATLRALIDAVPDKDNEGA